MKRLWIALNMVILYPSLWLSRLHLMRADVGLKLDLVRVWSSTFLRMMKLKPVLENQNHIPLEDGYVFLVEHKSNLDLLAIAQVLPVDFTLVMDANDSIFLIKPVLASLKPLTIDTITSDFTQLNEVLMMQLSVSKNLILFNSNLARRPLSPSFFNWIKNQGLTLIPISNDCPHKVYQWRPQHWSMTVHLPVPKEEYESLTLEAFQNLIQQAFDASTPPGQV